jgi:hypothetical protein
MAIMVVTRLRLLGLAQLTDPSGAHHTRSFPAPVAPPTG